MSKVPLYLRNQGIRVLEALGCFAYLTTDQMLDIGIAKNRDSLNRDTLKKLSERRGALLERRMYGDTPGKGKHAYLYKLTPKGAKVLAELLGVDVSEVKYHHGSIKVQSGYQHRIAQSDFHIAYARWAELHGKETEFFTYDYEMIGSQRHGNAVSKTQQRLNGKVKKPDMITRYQDGEKSRLLAVEIHNGRDSKRIFNQLAEYLEFIRNGVFEDAYNHETALFVLSVHEHTATLKTAKERLLALPEFVDLKPLFLFNTQDQIKADFAQGWTLADKEKTALF